MKGTNATAVWITWEAQPRNRSMARELGIRLHEFFFPGPRGWRHLSAAAASLRLLLRERPDVVFAPNPSLVLTYLLLLCRTFLGFRFVTDAHYGGVVSVTGSRLLQRLIDFGNRRADLVIVTNPGHAERVRQAGGTPFVCPDPLPHLSEARARPTELAGPQKSVLFVCSFDRDEPYVEVFRAARALTEAGFGVFVSGAYARVGIAPPDAPYVTLLGYVERGTYDAFLQHADVILDLTTWEDCLVCGAYEAMAAGKPCVLSRTPALMGLFTHGTVFTSHEPEDIVRAIQAAYENRQALQGQTAKWVKQYRQASRERAATLRATLRLPPAPT